MRAEIEFPYTARERPARALALVSCMSLGVAPCIGEESRFIMCLLMFVIASVVAWSAGDDRARMVGVACSRSEAGVDRSRRNGRERAPNVREKGRGMSDADRNLTWCLAPPSADGVLDLRGGRRDEGASKRRLQSLLIRS